jgi:hypothetical protein
MMPLWLSFAGLHSQVSGEVIGHAIGNIVANFIAVEMDPDFGTTG